MFRTWKRRLSHRHTGSRLQFKTHCRRLLLESLEDRRLLAVLPDITIGAGDSAAETLSETDTGLSVSDTLSVEDADVTDTVDAAVDSVSVTGNDNGIGNAALLAMMSVGPNPVIDNSSTTGTIDWTFDSVSEAFDHLAAGESLQLEYTLSVTDGSAGDPTLGDSASNPGLSALHILNNRAGATDGVYWIDPDGPGGNAPQQVYADMSTDGGGWTLVASTRDTTLNDQASLYYTDLTTLSPTAGHEGIWNGLRPVATGNSDIRFSARANAYTGAFDVDLAFYDIHWYDEITSSFNDADIAFEHQNGSGDTQPPPARRNLLNGDFRSLGDQWNCTGYLEGEDSPHDTGDFTVDFDDRGMDCNQGDGTDWGEDDHSKKAGIDGVSGGTWHIWVRELSTPVLSFPGDTQAVVITIDGTNDQPDITLQAGDSAAETLTETDTTLSVADTLSVEDPDITDTVSAAVVSVAESGDGTGVIGNATLLAMVTLGASSVIDGVSTTGTIDWTFDSGSEAFDHLSIGESQVLTYTVQTTDISGAGTPATAPHEDDSDTQAVVITIIGSNDAPDIAVEAGDSAAETLAETDAGLSVSDTLSAEDLDISDTVDAVVESVSVTGDDNGIGNAALLAMMTVGSNPVIDDSSTTGTIDWTFDSGSEAFDHLAAGESLQLEYTLSATDDGGDLTLGDSASNPGLSALHILNNRPSAADGVYWIDPDGAGGNPPQQVYADMSTDGGGWTLVASTRDATLNDQASLYYTDLTTLSPAAGHEGIWNGMRPMAAGNSDIRFSARANAHAGAFDVDLAFYNIHWYDEITSSFNDADIGFEQGNGSGDTQPPPARRNLLNGDYRPLGDQWNFGYLEGEDSASSTTDFTVDFDDRGMDSNQSDGTDWGGRRWFNEGRRRWRQWRNLAHLGPRAFRDSVVGYE